VTLLDRTKGAPPVSLCRALQKCDRLHSGHVEPLATANVLARGQIVPAHHIGLRLGESRPVALIGTTAKLCLLPADEPSKFIFVRLTAVWARQQVGALLRLFVEKVALFHVFEYFTDRRNAPSGTIVSPGPEI
jgi:hypothetical protein